MQFARSPASLRINGRGTPMPQFRFPGLVPGDRWCVTAANWLRAHRDSRSQPDLLTEIVVGGQGVDVSCGVEAEPARRDAPRGEHLGQVPGAASRAWRQPGTGPGWRTATPCAPRRPTRVTSAFAGSAASSSRPHGTAARPAQRSAPSSRAASIPARISGHPPRMSPTRHADQRLPPTSGSGSSPSSAHTTASHRQKDAERQSATFASGRGYGHSRNRSAARPPRTGS